MKKFTRRDFLKLSLAVSGGTALSQIQDSISRGGRSANGKPNIVIFVFDAMSARNLSVYNYPRATTPNLTRFAQNATVFHSHYSAGNFTTPGTASMLTGLYPWHHRAINVQGPIKEEVISSNIFRAVGEEYFRLGYTQNPLADIFLRQFHRDIDKHVPTASFIKESSAFNPSKWFPHDPATTYYALDIFPFTSRQIKKGVAGSLLWGYLDLFRRDSRYNPTAKTEEYPNGKPHNGFFYFENPETLRGIESEMGALDTQSQPYLAYFHLFSPHGPYAPRKNFVGNFSPLGLSNAQRHPVSLTNLSKKEIADNRDLYDAFISDLDYEFGITLDFLKQKGILDNSYVFVTSDHGELFERGEIGHGSSLMYDPVIHIPLLIAAPGQTQRMDVYNPTSNIDILPTLAHLAGQAAPSLSYGHILPGLGGAEDASRSIYSIAVRNHSSFTALKNGTIVLIKGEYRMIYYFGFPDFPDQFEMYLFPSDPDEKRNIFSTDNAEAMRMKDEILTTLDTANQPYRQTKG